MRPVGRNLASRARTKGYQADLLRRSLVTNACVIKKAQMFNLGFINLIRLTYDLTSVTFVTSIVSSVTLPSTVTFLPAYFKTAFWLAIL